MASARVGREVHYRESDGKPMAETTIHMEAMVDLILGLQDWFAADPLAYVAGNCFLYYVEGEPRRVVSPDIFVVRGIDKRRYRGSYKTWEDGDKGPDLVVEVSSKSTRLEDLRKKFNLYRDDLKVREYFLFDPLGEYLKPPLKGYRLVGGEYREIEPQEGRLPSEVVRLHLEADGPVIRLFDPANRRPLLTRLERIEAEKDSAGAKDQIIRAKDETIRALERAIRSKDEAIRAKEETIQFAEAGRSRAEAEAERLRRMLEDLQAGPRPKKRK